MVDHILFPPQLKTSGKGGIKLRKRLYRLLCFICAFTIMSALMCITVYADDYTGDKASVFARKLNEEMTGCGVLSTDEIGDFKAIDSGAGIYPSGIIYADIIDFDNNSSPYLVIFKADPARGCVSAAIYIYDEGKRDASLVNIISKGYNLPDGVSGEMTVGYNAEKRYIIYNEYTNGIKTRSEFYTAINGVGFSYMTAPVLVEETGVLSFKKNYLHPETDVSGGNYCLSDFFSYLKNLSANSVSYPDIADTVYVDELERIEKVLSRAARHSYLDIGQYSDINEYNAAMSTEDTDNIFYSITNLYDIGEQLYYARFATDNAFYNFALLRRTNSIEEGYQLAMVQCDTIPLSDLELANAKEAYTHNRLLYKKARGMIAPEPGAFKMFDIRQVFAFPKLISRDWRKPIGFIGGGLCIVLFAVLWVQLGSEPEEKA